MTSKIWIFFVCQLRLDRQMTFRVFWFQVIFSNENGARSKYSARRRRPSTSWEATGFLPGIEAEPAVGPVDEPMAEKIGERLNAFHGHEVDAPIAIHQAGRGEDMEVWVEVEAVAEGLHGSHRRCGV